MTSYDNMSKKLAALVVLGVRGVLGCTCGGPIPVCSVYWGTDTLFLGHVVRIEHVYDEPPDERVVDGKKITIIGPGQNLVHFDVTKVYRGARSSEQVVIHTADQGSACGYAFEQGRDYLVYASAGTNGELNTSHCTRTHEVASREDDADIQWMEGLARSPAGGSIFGQIRMMRQNQDGGYDTSALARVAVSIKGPDSKTLQSDAEGKFRADGLGAGKYVVSAKAPNQYTPFADHTVTIKNRACAEVDWSTSLDGHIRGHVYFNDGKPAAGLFMTTKAADAVSSEPWTWKRSLTTTGPDGAFDFAPVSPGTYIFGVNMDFSSADGKGYYRKALYPGTSNRAEAATITLGAGETVDNLNFYLPPDSPAPSIPVQVQVLGFDGMPVVHAEILAEDAMWENSPTPITATADENGKATIMLRPGSRYEIEALVNLPDFSQACAEPQTVEARGEPGPMVMKLSHPFGNCMPFKKAK
jgi:hypothetical protein